MRKLILLIVSFCYIASSSGVAVEWHYCMGKLRSVDIGTPLQHDACEKCGMEKKTNTCCKDNISFSKVTDAHQQIGAATYNPLIFTLFHPEQAFSFIAAFNPIAENILSVISPPPVLKTNRNTLFCVFRC